jgi:tRNA nucleotidyltransferase (CCA-adding enzyme)
VADGARRARLTPPRVVLDLVERLEAKGFEAWCVGGAVRDALLGHAHLDWDIATSARPEQVQRLFRRTVPVGIQFGTVGVLDDAGRLHEVTTFRRDVRTDGRHAEVEFGVSLDDDLARRDFTINAIAWSPTQQRLHDPFHGQRDLDGRLVRAVGTADARMREDRLRALRAIRFAARFGFAIEPATWQAIVDSAPHLGRLSVERVKQEIDKTLEQVRRPSEAFALWQRSGAFATLVPALAAAPATRFAVTDALPMPGLRGRPARQLLRVASLFAGEPSREVQRLLKGLRYSNADVAAVGRVVAGAEAVGPALGALLMGQGTDADGASRPSGSGVSDAALRPLVAAAGRTQWGLVLRLLAATWQAARARGEPAPSAVALCRVYRQGRLIALRDPIELADLAVDGDDLRRERIANGPALGRVLHGLLAAVIEDPSRNTVEQLLALARAMVAVDASPAGGVAPSAPEESAG